MKAAKVCFTFTNLRAFASNLQGERMHLCCPDEVKSHYRKVVCSFLRPSCFAEPGRFTTAEREADDCDARQLPGYSCARHRTSSDQSADLRGDPRHHTR